MRLLSDEFLADPMLDWYQTRLSVNSIRRYCMNWKFHRQFKRPWIGRGEPFVRIRNAGKAAVGRSKRVIYGIGWIATVTRAITMLTAKGPKSPKNGSWSIFFQSLKIL